MYSDGYAIADGSWDLRIYVTDLKVERTIRVKGDLHVGGVMFKLVEDLDVALDWSDHGLWWPKQNIWLSRTRTTLDQYGVQADALLHFTPMHKVLRIQLPDYQFVDTKVDLSVKAFSAVKELCKDFGIRHPEELSFLRPLSADHIKKNCRIMSATARQRLRDSYAQYLVGKKAAASDGTQGQQVHFEEGGIYGRNLSTPGPEFNHPLYMHHFPSGASDGGKSTPGLGYERQSTPITGHQTNGTRSATQVAHPSKKDISLSPINFHNQPTNSPVIGHHQQLPADTIYGINELSLTQGYPTIPNLSSSPSGIPPESKAFLLRPRNLLEKARLNASWVDSSLSLYEQDVREGDTLLLRFKFSSFYDLNPKLDGPRINEIYEQARWSLLTEEVDCTENEMMMFAALQLQVRNATRDEADGMGNGNNNRRKLRSLHDDDIDAALTDLEAQLEGSFTNGSSPSYATTGRMPRMTSHDTTDSVIHVPELSDYLRFSKPRRFTLRTTKKIYFVFRDTNLSAFKTREDRFGQPSFVINLRGCEITPDVNLSQLRYAIRLEVPGQEGMTEYNIRFSSEDQYAKWLAAFRLASKGKSMSDTAYDNEVRQILDFLSIQHPAPAPVVPIYGTIDVNPDDFVSPKYLRKAKSRNQLVHRILEAHSNVRDLSSLEAKMQLVKAWMALPEFGVALFVVRFVDGKREELLGVSSNKLMRMDTEGNHIKTWRYNTMKTWKVNWEIRQVQVEFEEEDVKFFVLSADCKVVHEFIGGYIFLSMRSKEANQTLNEELFHKLTGGWI